MKFTLSLLSAAALAATLAAAAPTAGAQATMNNPGGVLPGELPHALRDRGGIEKGPDAVERRELFTLQTMTFSFIDPTKSGHFVQVLDGPLREASVQVVDVTKSLNKTFLYRARCDDRTYYFGPRPTQAEPALKKIDDGSVGDLLYKQVCGG